MTFIYSASLLEFFDSIPEFFTFYRVSFEVSLDIVWHALCEFTDSTRAHSFHIDQFLVVELIDEREHVPEEIAYLELEFIVIFVLNTFFDLSYFTHSTIEIVVYM